VTYAKLALNEMGRAIELFKRDVGRYPTTSQGLTALVQNDVKTPGWNGPYLLSVPADPWGHRYLYEYSQQTAAYRLQCQGEDGAPGGQGAASDLTVRPDTYMRILDPNNSSTLSKSSHTLARLCAPSSRGIVVLEDCDEVPTFERGLV
jgi:type II secretion system protein G